MTSNIKFRLMMITDEGQSYSSLIKKVTEACKYGFKAVQLRNKKISTQQLLKLAKELRRITSKFSANLFINDRADIALLSKADGIHFPSGAIDIKSLLSYNILLGKSTHSLKDAKESFYNRCDYILFGPVFETASKLKYGKPQGLKKLQRICEQIEIPVFAVGGITPKRAKMCLKVGAYGVAVISAISKSDNLKRTISEFEENLGGL